MTADHSKASLLGHTADGAPVSIRYADRTAHLSIIGKSRFGKTTLLEHLITDDQRWGTGAIVIDAQGDLTKRIVELASPEAREKIIIVDVNETLPFGLNLYECHQSDSLSIDRTVDNIVELFKKVFLDEDKAYYPVIEEGLRTSAYVIVANNYTMVEVPALFKDGAFRRQALRAVSNPAVRAYWRDYDTLTRREQRDLYKSVLNKVDRFLNSPPIRAMVGQPRTSVPIKKVLEHGGTLIFNLGGDASLGKGSVSFLGMVLLCVLSNIVMTRTSIPRATRRRVHLYLDEYGQFANLTTDRMLEEYGKYEIGITVAHQNLAQVGGKQASTANLVFFQVDGVDAQKLALNFDATPQRRRQVARLRTEPIYEPRTVIDWDSEESEAYYKLMPKKSEEARIRKVHETDRLDGLEKALNYRGHDNSYADAPSLWHREMTGGGAFVRNARNGTTPTFQNMQDAHQLFNPRPVYFVDVMAKLPVGQRTASGLVRITRDLETGTLYEHYRLHPEASRHIWIVLLLRYARHRGSRDDAPLAKWDHLREFALRVEGRALVTATALYAEAEFRFPVVPGLDEPSPAIGAERLGDWTGQARWPIINMMPAVQEIYHDVQVRQYLTRLWQKDEAANNWESQKRFLQAHGTERIEQIYHGEKPVREEKRVMRARPQIYRGRAIPGFVEHVEHIQLYDMVDESDQTHADRQGEIATMLANLPKFTAYCKLLDEAGNPREYRITTSASRQAVSDPMLVESIAARSREAFGTPRPFVDEEIAHRYAARSPEPNEAAIRPISRRPPSADGSPPG